MQLSNNQSDEMAELVATGRDGRVHYTREQRERVLDLFEKSGMSGKAFAEKYGIKYPTFALWRRQQREKPEGDTGGFVLAETPSNTSLGSSANLPGTHNRRTRKICFPKPGQRPTPKAGSSGRREMKV